jgi:hypothetical protein
MCTYAYHTQRLVYTFDEVKFENLTVGHAATVVLLGGLGGLLYWLAIFPIDVVKSSMQSDNIIPSKRQFPTMATTVKVSFDEGHRLI